MSDELPYIFADATPEQQAIARQSALYKKGDMSLVWMNDSALAELFLPKAEVYARIEYARQSALEEAARRARHYATVVPMHGSLKSDIYEAAGQAATEIATSIEALAEKGVADLAAQAKREALAEAARRLEELHKNHNYDPESGALTKKLGRYDGWPESAKVAKLEHDTGYYRAIAEGVAHIRALKGETND
jgi:hypothetical protein